MTQPPIFKQEINVMEGIIRAVTPLKMLFLSKGIRDLMDIPSHLPTVEAESNRFNQMLSNYLTNALKYTPSGGQVTISAHQEGNFIKVSVTDTGKGLSSEEQKTIFEITTKEEAAEYEATGMGSSLYAVKGMAKDLGGEVGVESEPGKGSTFWFKLPVYKKA